MTIDSDRQLPMTYIDQEQSLNRIDESAEVASRAFNQFRTQQTILGGNVTTADKAQLRRRLEDLDSELDHYLAAQYGIDPEDGDTFSAWQESHQPFHWLVEFYSIMKRGGFDVVIGNPPYVEYRTIRSSYSVRGIATESCGNLYALVWERSIQLSSHGHIGFIVPVSAVCTDRYVPLRKLLNCTGDLVISNFNDRPSRLFDGIEHGRLCIILLHKDSDTRRVFSTTYNKWRSLERDTLFQRLAFVDSTRSVTEYGLPKIGHSVEDSILKKFSRMPLVFADSILDQPKENLIYYTRKLSYFVQILDFIPQIYDASSNLRRPSELKEIRLDSGISRDSLLGFLNSSLFYWLITVFSDCRNLNRREIEMARLNTNDEFGLMSLALAAQDLMDDIRSHSQMKKTNYGSGTLTIQSTYPRLSKEFIDRLDTVLAEQYNLTEEELDFIINYDIKYRMGLGSSG